jgi:hypothetical protein
MLQTARAEGWAVTLELASGQLSLNTEGMTRAATLELRPAAAIDSPLHSVIPLRHTDRSTYREDPVRSDLLESLVALNDSSNTSVFLFTHGQQSHKSLSDATIAATEYIIADTQMSHDSHRWFDKSWEELQRDKDGPFIDTSGAARLIRAAVKLMPPVPDRMLDDGWLTGTINSVPGSPVLGLITVRDLYSQTQSMQAGQLWQRMHLWATTQNVSMQPINQLPERVDRERQLGLGNVTEQWLSALTGTTDMKTTFVFRLGHPANRVFPSARRPVTDVLLA